MTIAGMGDIYNPETKPFAIIHGTKWEKLTSWERVDVEKSINGHDYGLKNIKFNAFIGREDPIVYYSNKTAEKYKNDIDAIIKNWSEFHNEEPEIVPRQNMVLEEITKCNCCGMKKLPGRRMHGYSQSHSICIMCMMESVASWLATERQKI